MTRTIDIPKDMLFDGTVPAEAANVVLAELEAATENQIPEWKRKRIGKITASRFGDVKRIRSGEWGETALSYLYDLVGEHLTGQPSETFTGNRATEWGNFYEADALNVYKRRTRRKVQPGLFCQHPALPWVGGTPDAFCGSEGVLEVKCPLSFKNHLRTVITRQVPSEYIDQVLGHLWLSGRQYCNFISYDPRISGPHGLAIVRVDRKEHEGAIDKLAERIAEFHELLIETLQRLKVKPGKNIQL